MVAIAQAYLEAWSADDFETALSYLAPGAVVVDSFWLLLYFW